MLQFIFSLFLLFNPLLFNRNWLLSNRIASDGFAAAYRLLVEERTFKNQKSIYPHYLDQVYCLASKIMCWCCNLFYVFLLFNRFLSNVIAFQSDRWLCDDHTIIEPRTRLKIEKSKILRARTLMITNTIPIWGGNHFQSYLIHPNSNIIHFKERKL